MHFHTSDSSSGFSIIEVVVVIVLLLMVGGGVYVWQQSEQRNQEVAQLEEDSTVQTTDSPTPTPDPIPAGWVEHTSDSCDVTVAIPPKQSPYIETSAMHGDAYWDFQEGLLDSTRPFASHANVAARFGYATGTPTGAGDVVMVACSERLDQPTTLESLKQKYQDSFHRNPPTAEKFEDGKSVTVTGEISSIKESTVGNMKALRVEVPDFSRGLDATRQEYLVATNHREYVVSVSELGWPGGGVGQKIFENIRF